MFLNQSKKALYTAVIVNSSKTVKKVKMGVE